MNPNLNNVRGFSYNGETAYAPVDVQGTDKSELNDSDYYFRRVLLYAQEMDRIYEQQGRTPGLNESGEPQLLPLLDDAEKEAIEANRQIMDYVGFMLNPDPTLMVRNISIVKDNNRYRTLRASQPVVYDVDGVLYQARITEDTFYWNRRLTSRGYVLYLGHVDENSNLITRALYRFNYKAQRKSKPLTYDYAGYPIVSQEQFYFVQQLLEEIFNRIEQ